MYKARLPRFNVRKYGKHKNTIPPLRKIGPPTTRPHASNAEKIVFHARRYSEIRFEPGNTSSSIPTLQFMNSTSLPPDELLWQNTYKGLALLEQGAKNEAFGMLNAACQLARPVLLSQPRLIFRAIFMVFGTTRWQRFKDVWRALLRFLAAMASTVLQENHPISCGFRALCENEAALDSSAELTLRQLLWSLETRLSPVHPEILRTRRNLAVVLRRQSELDESEDVMRRTVTTCEEQLGFVHVETLRCLRRLASLYMHHGRLEQAEELFIEALRRAGRPDNTCGPTTDDTDTFVYANRDLAIIAMQQQDLEKCLPRLQAFSWVCRNKLSVANVRYTRAIAEPPQPLTMFGAEQYIKDVAMAYDLHCDELASRLMSSSARRTMSGAPEMDNAPATSASTATSSAPQSSVAPRSEVS